MPRNAGPNQLEWTKRGNATYANDLLGLARENNTSGITENYTRTPDGTPIGHREGSSGANRNYIHTDALGSTSAVTDGSGAKVGGYTYDPYGNFLTANPDNSSVDFRFAGQYRSTSLSLYKMGLRWYDPKVGRWTQADPVDQASDLRGGAVTWRTFGPDGQTSVLPKRPTAETTGTPAGAPEPKRPL